MTLVPGKFNGKSAREMSQAEGCAVSLAKFAKMQQTGRSGTVSPKYMICPPGNAMAYTYDDGNVFARILRGEIPNQTVMETEYSLAFRDINPQAPEHIVAIPKGAYVNYDDFAKNATEAEIVDFTRMLGVVCEKLGIDPGNGGAGYRLITNAGKAGLQEVPHMHVHVLAGRTLGPILARK